MAPNYWDQWGWNQQQGHSWGNRSDQEGKGMWQCPDVDCIKLMKAKNRGACWMLSHAKKCRCCEQPRPASKQQVLSAAETEKLKAAIAERKAKANGDGDASADAPPKPLRKSKKARKAKRNKEEKEEVVDPLTEEMEVSEDEPPADEASSPALAADEARKKQRRTWLGLPLPTQADNVKLYPLAGPTVKGSAEEVAAKALVGQASEAVAARQKKVAELYTAAGTVSRALGEKSQSYLLVAAELEAEKKALQKLTKSTPAACSKTTEERLRKVRKDVSDEHAARALRAQNGREKATQRFAADSDSLDEAISLLTQRKVQNAAAFLASQTSFASYDESRKTQDAAVLAIIDAKITQATPLGGASAVAAGPVQTAPAPAVLPEYADLELRANVQPWDLPVIDAIKPEEKEQLDAMWSFFLAVPPGTAMPPITYKTLGATKMDTVANLLGQTAMSKVYGGRTIYTSAFVPWNVLELLRYAMTQAHSKLSEIKELEQGILDRLQAARDAAKENGYTRIGPY